MQNSQAVTGAAVDDPPQVPLSLSVYVHTCVCICIRYISKYILPCIFIAYGVSQEMELSICYRFSFFGFLWVLANVFYAQL